MKRFLIIGFMTALACVSSCSGVEKGTPTRPVIPDQGAETEKEGEVLSAWKEGTLDIHFINTGRGDATFYVLPDGTTMLVDMAGSTMTTAEANKEGAGKDVVAMRPNASTSAADVIVNYINHFTSEASRGHIDYAVLTHFHEDHMGTYRTSLPDGGDGSFKMTSLAEVGTRLPYKNFLDRAYPDYNYPYAMTAAKFMNVRNFAKWSAANNGTKLAWFNAGALNQIALVNNAGKYPSFKVQNLSSNGRFWTGNGENYEMKMPASYSDEASMPDENCFSCAFRLSYGKFDFYSGGDHQYQGRSTYSYKDSEAPVAAVVGSVDVAKADHHGTKNCNSSDLMNKMKPSAWIAHVWREPQPYSGTLTQVQTANPNCDMYLTNLYPSDHGFTAAHEAKILTKQGHVVVRVAEGGDSYVIYVLDDSDMKYKIKSSKTYKSK